MFQFIFSKLAGFISVLVAFVSPLSAQPLNSSEKQNMELIAHKQIGSGKEKVLVMHNWMGDSTSYDSMLSYLNTDKYTYVFVDLRGYGRSKEMRGTYSVEESSAASYFIRAGSIQPLCRNVGKKRKACSSRWGEMVGVDQQ
jgi:pimeloyl-ACP methyl ester carboxylesterase